MSLAAAQVVSRVAALLLAGATAAGSNVFTGRNWPFAEVELPALKVYADDEAVQRVTIDYPWLQEHQLSVVVQGCVQASSALDTSMHDLAEDVLQVLFSTQANASLQPLVNVELALQSIGRRMSDGPADAGEITLTLTATFRTFTNDPSTLV